MLEALVNVIKSQEEKIEMVRKTLLFRKRTKCPHCRTMVFLNHPGKPEKHLFFCTECNTVFSR